MNKCSFQSPLQKLIKIPPSKSHTLRALIFAMMSKGTSSIFNPLPSPDTDAMIEAIRSFGGKVTLLNDRIEVVGAFESPSAIIDAGNSGIVYRFIAGISSLLDGTTEITGDHSIRTRRPIIPLLNALAQLGAKVQKSPVRILGPIKPGSCSLTGEDSQPISSLLIATSFLEGKSEIHVKNPGEKPWIDVTLHWLRRLGARIEHENYERYIVHGFLSYDGFEYTVPGDFSSAAFPIAKALVTGTEVRIGGLDQEDIQGDKLLIDILCKMGAKIHWDEDLFIERNSSLEGTTININKCIDALPILAVIGCFAKGKTEITGAEIARSKECDRISAICMELRKMGAKIEERPGGLVVEESSLVGTRVDSHHDHRIAMSLAIASFGATGKTSIANRECIAKTYPNFDEIWREE